MKEDLNNNQKKTIFKLRTRMERFGENFRCGKAHIICPLCGLHWDSQDLSLQCPEIKKEIESNGDTSEIYKDNFGNEIIHMFTKVLEKRSEALKKEL